MATPFLQKIHQLQMIYNMSIQLTARPVITHLVNRARQHLQQATKTNFMAVKQILRNIKGTLNYGIRFLDQSSISLYAFVNFDWAGCPITRRSTTSFCVYLGTNCISRNKGQ